MAASGSGGSSSSRSSSIGTGRSDNNNQHGFIGEPVAPGSGRNSSSSGLAQLYHDSLINPFDAKASDEAAVRRPRAGTMPSTFHMGSSDAASLSTDSLLSPGGPGLHTRPDNLRRRLSGLPLNTPSSSASGTSSSLARGVLTPSSLSVNASSSSSDQAHFEHAPGSGALPPAVNSELRTSLLRASQPISPDPVASARLRSGSLTLPPPGLGNAFTPGVFGPPGSWTPRSASGLSTPLGMPPSSIIIPEEASAKSPTPTSAAEEEQAKASIGGIIDFLNIDDSMSPTQSLSPNLPLNSLSANAGTGNGLLAPGRRPSGSLSVPSSTHPSILNLRQTFEDHSSGAMPSNHSAPESSYTTAASLSVSPTNAAARLRANTAVTPDPQLRKASPFRHLTVSNGSGNAFVPTEADASTADGFLGTPTRTLADLTLDENINQSTTLYEAPGPSSGYKTGGPNSTLLSANRPRASTIGILNEALLQEQQLRKRAGTTAGFGPPSSLMRTPLYEGSKDGYLDSAGMAEADDEHEYNGHQAETSDPWADAGPLNRDTTQASPHDGQAAPQNESRQAAGTPPPAPASRSLWIGNIDHHVTSQDLYATFGSYGTIETVRMLYEKDCAFVNYYSVYDAVHAKEDILNSLGGQIMTQAGASVTIRIGYAKADSAPPTPAMSLQNRAGPAAAAPFTPSSNFQATFNSEVHLQTSPTRALWIGAIPPTTSHTDLLKVFAPYGAIESARVLVHKQCGFCNFEHLDDAVRARKALNGKEILGNDVGPVKIGFAKVPNKAPELEGPETSPVNPASAYAALKRLGGATAIPVEEQISTGHLENYRSPMALTLAANGLSGTGPHSAGALTQSLQPAVGLSPGAIASELAPSPRPGAPAPSVSEQQVLIRELSGDPADPDALTPDVVDPRPPLMYYTTVPPPMDEYGHHRARNLDAPRLRDIRKRLETPPPHVSQAEVDALTSELLDDIVPLASDYIGNVVVQKLFERGSTPLRLAMLERIAPYLASIACHKNGTWAAQNETVSTPSEIALVCGSLRAYVPPLLLDQFGNYAAQLCLRFYAPISNFLFDAMVDRCWEIGSGRFGARSVRTCLENPNTTLLQQKRVAVSILLNSVLLATNANGALLLTWLLDTSNLPGRYRLLATRLSPHLAQLCPHKVASVTILKVINQRADPASSQILVDAILKSNETQILEDILSEQVHGSSFIFKLLSSPHVDPVTRDIGAQKVRAVLQKNPSHHSPAYAKLCNEVGLPPPAFTSGGPQTPPSGKHQRPSPHHAQYPGGPGRAMGNGSPFSFPAFGSPLSPGPMQQGRNSASPVYARQPSPLHPVQINGVSDMPPYDPYRTSPFEGPDKLPQSMEDRHYNMRSPAMIPSLAGGPQHGAYADQYLQNVAALQMSGFSGYPSYPGYPGYPPPGAYSRMNPSPLPYGHHPDQALQPRPL